MTTNLLGLKIPKPSEIDLTNHFFGCFGKYEREISARWIVRFCLQNGDTWEPFQLSELEGFYNQAKYKNFWFNGLDNDGHISNKDNLVTPMLLFVAKLPLVKP